MKVLIVHPSFWIEGGAEKTIINLCNYMTDHFIDNTILTTSISPEVSKKLKETRILEAGNYLNMYGILQSIYNDFDIINVHNDPAQLMIYPSNMKSVWSFNELPQKIQLGGNLEKKEIEPVKNFIKKIIVADKANKKKVKDVYGMDSVIIPYGVDKEFFDDISKEEFVDIRDRFNIEKDEFLITQVGFIAPTKNQVESIKILAELKKYVPKVKLILAGLPLPEYKKLVDEEISKLKVYNEVIFTGKLEKNEIVSLLKQSDCVLQPNRGQGSWLSVYEGMASYCPVVVSSEFSSSEEIEEYAFVCKNLQEYIDALLKIKDNKQKDLKQAYNFAKKFTWEKYCERMVEEFKSL